MKTNRKQREQWRERKQDSLARKALLGLKEVRGLWLPPELHQQAKQAAQKLLRRTEHSAPPPSERPKART